MKKKKNFSVVTIWFLSFCVSNNKLYMHQYFSKKGTSTEMSLLQTRRIEASID